jgi:hypothetical protein
MELTVSMRKTRVIEWGQGFRMEPGRLREYFQSQNYLKYRL